MIIVATMSLPAVERRTLVPKYNIIFNLRWYSLLAHRRSFSLSVAHSVKISQIALTFVIWQKIELDGKDLEQLTTKFNLL